MSEYTLEELIYEYYLINEKAEYRRELDEEEADKIEEAKVQADSSWADEMEAEEEEMERKKAEKKKAKKAPESKPEQPPYDPSKDPKNLEWMEKEIEKSKLFFGDDFGEDLSLSFDDKDK